VPIVTVALMAALATTVSQASGATTQRVNVFSSAQQATGGSYDTPAISANDRYVAFSSPASNLVVGDTNRRTDVFVRDRITRTTHRLSVSGSGAQATSSSFGPAISATGLMVAFSSSATNLVAGDTNGRLDVFVRNRAAGSTHRVSVSSHGRQANGSSLNVAMSAKARYVVFQSSASNLVRGDTAGNDDIFVRDVVAGTTRRLSVSTHGAQANADSTHPAISADGRYVVFDSFASNLVPGDSNGREDVFVHDRVTGQTHLLSISSRGVQGALDSELPVISGDGRYVAFDTRSGNLVPGDTNNKYDVFVRDRGTGTTRRVSVASDGTQGDRESGHFRRPSISAHGRFIAFQSWASTLVSGDTNSDTDVFIRDIGLGTTERVSVSSAGAQATGESFAAAISADGRCVGFDSTAGDLVADDTNGAVDVFLRARLR
jgi:Tol biopolymer transport system component